MQIVTALAGGGVAVSYHRGPTRVLEATSGDEVRSLRGVSRVIALRPDLSLAVSGGWCRVLERARVNDHFRHVVHDPATDTWVVIHATAEGQYSLLRLTHDADVLEQRPCIPVHDAATMRGGRTLVLITDEGVQLLDCSDWSTGTVAAVTAPGSRNAGETTCRDERHS